jgi:predicted DNA-binding protein (MmcQ/YjbR family)
MTNTHADIRAIAMAQPEAVEIDHHGFPSFRVAGKIFCTLREESPRLMVKLTPEHQHNFVEAFGGAIEAVPGYWGRKGATFVDFSAVDRALIVTLIELSWARVAPRRLTRS